MLWKDSIQPGLVGGTIDLDTNRDASLSRAVSALTGFPPIFITAKGDESLTDSVRTFADNAKAHGVRVELEIAPEMQHAFQWTAGRAPAAADSVAQAAASLQNHLDATG